MISALQPSKDSARIEHAFGGSFVLPLSVQPGHDAGDVDQQGKPEWDVHGADYNAARGEGLCRTS